MATIKSRSRYIIKVMNHEDLYREFPFTKHPQAKQYATHLKADGFKPISGPREDTFFVSIPSKGYAVIEARSTLPLLDTATFQNHGAQLFNEKVDECANTQRQMALTAENDIDILNITCVVVCQ